MKQMFVQKKHLTVYFKKESSLNMSNQKITNSADGTDPNDAVNFKHSIRTNSVRPMKKI